MGTAKTVTYADMVQRILDEMEGQKNRLKADKIAKVLGRKIRVRARRRLRQAGDDIVKAVERIVKEATERD